MNTKVAKFVASVATTSLLFSTAADPLRLGGQDSKTQNTSLTDRRQQLAEQAGSLKNEYMQLVGKRDSTGVPVIPYSYRQFPYNPGNPSMEAGLNGKLPSGFQTAIDSSAIDGNRKIRVWATLFDHYPRPFKWIEGMLKSGEVYGAEKALGIVGDYVTMLKSYKDSVKVDK